MRHLTSILTAAFLLAVSADAYSQSQSQAQSQSQPQAQSQAQKQPQAQPQVQKPPQGQQPQSLAEFARKEKERREKVTAALKSITNDDASKYRDASVATVVKPVPPEAEKKTGEEAETQPQAVKPEATPGSDEPVDMQGRTEGFWRQTFTDARQKVKSLEDQENVLVLKLNDLQNRFYREDNGFKQQEIQREIQKTIYEQDKNKEDLKKAKDELSDLEKEARKSGALPGWFSGKKPE